MIFNHYEVIVQADCWRIRVDVHTDSPQEVPELARAKAAETLKRFHGAPTPLMSFKTLEQIDHGPAAPGKGPDRLIPSAYVLG